ncbi:MAG: hypothetical protein CMA83_01565 [Euryarchaeota archaeon]|jgi:hypothetical protein|nr:hypothetical protein [Euryarchaeota archaeon]|tara:strand:+ start:128 stop:517 length:390 start_codon:yes stop_codon:yes gene_type:complete
MSDEFTVSGLTIPRIAIYEGAILVLWGVAAYIISGQSSITAMIPSFMGAPLMILGLLSEKIPDMRHHLMHASMVMALLMVLGGARVFADFSDMSNLAISSHIILIFVGVTFMICGIMSFRAARLAREAE